MEEVDQSLWGEMESESEEEESEEEEEVIIKIRVISRKKDLYLPLLSIRRRCSTHVFVIRAPENSSKFWVNTDPQVALQTILMGKLFAFMVFFLLQN